LWLTRRDVILSGAAGAARFDAAEPCALLRARRSEARRARSATTGLRHDESNCPTMNRDDLVSHHGRLYFVRGFDPAGVLDARVYLEDAETREQKTVPLEELRGARRLYGTEPRAGR
jgi:hypothetical protein